MLASILGPRPSPPQVPAAPALSQDPNIVMLRNAMMAASGYPVPNE